MAVAPIINLTARLARLGLPSSNKISYSNTLIRNLEAQKRFINKYAKDNPNQISSGSPSRGFTDTDPSPGFDFRVAKGTPLYSMTQNYNGKRR